MVRLKGLDLRCGEGRLGLQSAPGALPGALGFESHGKKRRSCSKMENFAQLLFYGQTQKNSSRIRSLSENYLNFTQSTL